MENKRDYIYYDHTISLCIECHRQLSAKIIFENDKVYLTKTCKEHGFQKVLIAVDIEYYKQIRNFNKAGEYPKRPHTQTIYGCPYDCGICPDHEQHSCLTLIEVTDRCNLACPTCYASSSPTHGRHRTLEEIEMMLDAIVASEGEPDVVQLSGGEPTIHPDFFKILDLAKTNSSKNTIVYEQDAALHSHVMKIFSTANSPLSASQAFNQLLCCLPNVIAEGLSYHNLFRIIIMNFMDAYDFDVRSIKKSCVHIVAADGKIIPFETMNLFYREDLKPKLEKLRNESL